MDLSVVGVGEVLWDLLLTGPQLGGAPANFAYHAHALGSQAQVITRVGNDDYGREIIRRFHEMACRTPLCKWMKPRRQGSRRSSSPAMAWLTSRFKKMWRGITLLPRVKHSRWRARRTQSVSVAWPSVANPRATQFSNWSRRHRQARCASLTSIFGRGSIRAARLKSRFSWLTC